MRRIIFSLASIAVIAGGLTIFSAQAYASKNCGDPNAGGITTSIDFGCSGTGNQPIADLLFAIIRFLSIGVGIMLIGSTVVAGLQYTSSQGDTNAVAKSKARLRANAIALLFFLFGFALLNFVVPGQVLK
ncbi:MAG: hypothetical protein JWM37_217 [Candidatus Saccharibacteria bacterium]|nr:hypothetical protein [Candidatus Saccharibacteria bacterium]